MISFIEHKRNYDSSVGQSESHLSHEWLVPIIKSVDPANSWSRKWEEKNQNGRCDLILYHNSRPICVIETKKTDVNIRDKRWLRQLHKYIYANNYWRNGILQPVLGILTNGMDVVILDGRKKFIDAESTKIEFRLDSIKSLGYFLSILRQILDADTQKFFSPIERSTKSRPEDDDVIESLTKDLMRIHHGFMRIDKKNSFEMTLQIFILAILRDCGFVPTAKIEEFYSAGTWGQIRDEINRILNSNFKVSIPHKDVVNEIYDESRFLSARLDVVPPDCLGVIYERLLHKTTKASKKTSFYTSYELAYQIIDSMKIDIKSKIIDPSCGSGTFLTTVIDYLYRNDLSIKDTMALGKFIQNNIRGVDKEHDSCSVAKTMLLACFAGHAGLDFVRQKSVKIPNFNQCIIESDFFQLKSSFRPTHIVGNAPWKSIDSKDCKDEILDPAVRKKINFGGMNSFSNIDLCQLFLRQSVDLFPDAKIGILIKQQCLYNRGCDVFHRWARGNDFSFIDYGDRSFFRKNKSSITAAAFRKISLPEYIVDGGVKWPRFTENMIKISSYFHIFESFQAHDVFVMVANRLRKHVKDEKSFRKNFPFVRKIYPTAANSEHFNLPKSLTWICYIPNGEPIPRRFLDALTPSDKKRLSERVSRGRSRTAREDESAKKMGDSISRFTFKGTEGKEYYKFDSRNGVRIACPIHINRPRQKAMLDRNGECIPKMDHSAVFIPKSEIDENTLLGVLAWLNSSFFYYECLRVKLKRISLGRMKLQGKEKLDICVPERLLSDDFCQYVKANFVGKMVTEEMLNDLDTKIMELCGSSDFFSRIKSCTSGNDTNYFEEVFNDEMSAGGF